MISPLARLAPLLWPSDFLDDWAPDIPEEGDHEAARSDREASRLVEADPRARVALYPVVDVEAEAASATYANGKVKRTRYRRVDLRKRRVVIGGHQAGVERGEARWRKTVHRVTCHRAVGPSGVRYRVHPLDVRLVCTNRFDRSPWHCIGIEQLGNNEGEAGTGNWYRPEVFGRGYLCDAEAEALYQEICAIRLEVEDMGARVEGVVPHRVAGKGRNGKPNRPICCGSAIWEVYEKAALDLGLRVPADGQTWGGLSIPASWRSRYFPELQAAGLVGLK